MAFCTTDDDCTISTSSNVAIRTGTCSTKNRCECIGSAWTGPRCTSALSVSDGESFGPSLYITISTFGTAFFVLLVVMCVIWRVNRVNLMMAAARKHHNKSKFAVEEVRESNTVSENRKLSRVSSANVLDRAALFAEVYFEVH
ncbi:hypothetical protein Gpo141_00014256 [Globisporangium polare]